MKKNKSESQKTKERVLIKLAFNSLKFKYLADSPTTIKGLNEQLNECKSDQESDLNSIEEITETISIRDVYISNLETIIKQVEIEEYKILNPHAKDIFYP